MPKADTTGRLDDAAIDRAKAVRVADVAVERGLTLKRAGRELVGPCPLCGGTDRFSIHRDKDVFNCRGCVGKGGGAISFLMWLDGCGFQEAVELLVGAAASRRNRLPVHLAPAKPAPVEDTDHDRRQHAKASWLWSRRQPLTGSIAEAYLRGDRGLTCPLPSTLAFLPPTKPEHHPAMIAAFALPEEIEPGVLGAPRDVGAVHLTLLKPDGSGKAVMPDDRSSKIVVGRSSLPIVLAPVNDLLGLVIIEGIEEGLSAYQASGLGCWAAGAAGRMPRLADAIPSYVESVTVSIDDDKPGRSNAAKLAGLLRQRGVEVRGAL